MKHALFLAWIIAAGATLGSLVLSEFFDLIPCVLCWWQRIFMFSAAAILTVAEYYKDEKIYRYVFPLVIIGGGFALYHTLLQWGIVPETLTCSVGESCSTKQVELLGFITIPFMSLMTFIAIGGLMWLLHKKQISGTAKIK